MVFFIFLFQLWLYPKDKRRNEYGEFIEEPVPETESLANEESIPPAQADASPEAGAAVINRKQKKAKKESKEAKAQKV